MRRFIGKLLLLLWLLFFMANLNAETILTTDQLISESDLTFENQSLVVDGATVTINGEHTFNSLSLINGATITHSTTISQQFKLVLNILNEISISTDSSIDVSQRGFQEYRTFGNTSNGASRQSGGGSYGGYGHKGSDNVFVNELYGDFLSPNELGSGGGFDGVGGAGGGLLRITAQQLILEGSIKADGGDGEGSDSPGGSGGGIYISVTTMAGSGVISSNGGRGHTEINVDNSGGAGGGGRIAVYYQTKIFDLNNISAFGGAQADGFTGGAGTIYTEKQDLSSVNLIIDNDGQTDPRETIVWYGNRFNLIGDPIEVTFSLKLIEPARLKFENAPTINFSGSLNLTGVELLSDGNINANDISIIRSTLTTDSLIADTISLQTDSILTSLETDIFTEHRLEITATTVTVDSTSSIDVSGKGYRRGRTNGNIFFLRRARGRSGASYGGYGSVDPFNPIFITNEVYGDFLNPNELGSGSDVSPGIGGEGGGLVRIEVSTLNNNGVIRANGNDALDIQMGGGSGGGIYIKTDILTGTGKIFSIGGNGFSGLDNNLSGGSGGGGRIAVYYNTSTFDSS